MRINTNTQSLNAQSNLQKSQKSLGSAIERLASGLRINRAADDAAGLGISNRMDSRLRGKDQARRNAEDAKSMLATVDSAIEEIISNVQRIRELGVQKVSDTFSAADKVSIQKEIDQLLAENDRISGSLQFNGQPAGLENTLSFQIGSEAAEAITFDFQSLTRFNIGMSKNEMRDLSAPVDEIFIDHRGTKAPNTYYPITNESLTVEFYSVPGDESSLSLQLNGIEEVAAHFGVSVDDVQFLRRVHSSNNQYIIAIGDNYYYKRLNDVGPGTSSVSPEGNFQTTLRFGLANFYITDPNTGARTYLGDLNTPMSSGMMNANANGQAVRHVEYQGKFYTYSIGGNDTSSPAYELLPSREIQMMPHDYIGKSDAALQYLGDYRAKLGAMMNRLDSVTNGLNSDYIALTAARSRIQDADYALEVSNMTRGQILQQAGQAVLAQANQLTQSVLTLLK